MKRGLKPDVMGFGAHLVGCLCLLLVQIARKDEIGFALVKNAINKRFNCWCGVLGGRRWGGVGGTCLLLVTSL